MHRRLWLSVTMLVAGASLLVAASLASAAGNGHQAQALKKGGIWRLADDRVFDPDRSAARLRYDRLVARVRDRSEALQLSG